MAEGTTGQNALDRASLLQMLVRAQDRTPRDLEFLYGKTYALLPVLLIPRFLEEDKPASQAVMNMLNIRYGLGVQDDLGNIKTWIAWGIISEAFVNFGMLGVAGMGLIMGTLCGMMTRLALASDAASLKAIFAVVSLGSFINLEYDFTYLCTILFQSFFVAVVMAAFAQMYSHSGASDESVRMGAR